MNNRIIFLIAPLFISCLCLAQETPHQNKSIPETEKYCAVLMKGKQVILLGGKPIATEVTLLNGTKITAEGMVKVKDGPETILKNGQCVDKDGNISDEKNKEEKKIKKKNQ